ncbi:MAG: glycosyltransferase family 4 protein [Phycisphaerales bacterium]
MISREGQPDSDSARRLRVALFTDTLGDVNGVSRFLNDIADRAIVDDRDLHILTSTRFAVRALPMLHNVVPRAAIKLPGYRDLEFVLPPARRLLRAVRALQPDVIHVSTPGPVGFVGRWIAGKLGVPLAGVYHTDFPAYVDRLFEDEALTHVSRGAMKAFYRPFRVVFSRSAEYGASLAKLGIDAFRRMPLRPGFTTSRFHPRYRDERCWGSYGIPAGCVKVLYVGRVSVEKNMPLLTEIWKRVRRLAPEPDARLVVVGDGPYRATMESALAGMNATFLGFRYGDELAKLYASSDLFVFPSVTDTLGQVTLESQASGLPALVTNVGGPKEVVRDGETGFVLAPDDAANWARRIVKLAQNDGLRKSMGGAAHWHVQQFSIQGSFDHFWQIHEQVARSGLPATQFETKPRIAEAIRHSNQLDSVPA